MPTTYFGVNEQEKLEFDELVATAKQEGNSSVFLFKGHYIKLENNAGTWAQKIISAEQAAQLNQSE